MQVTNFRLKYWLYKITFAGFQLLDIGTMHPVRVRAKRALAASVDYIEKNMPEAIGLETQKELLCCALDATKVKGHYVEFGVFSGGTIRFMAKRHPHKTFHGFDSFEGLPGAWGGSSYAKGTFTRGGNLPSVPYNAQLYKGWFSDSLPKWLAANAGPVAFVHIDCDIYSSTVDVLKHLADRLQVGTVIAFDEYFNYPNWENHEYKAWKELVEKKQIGYEYLAYARQQVAVRITRIG
jgi:Macrocin-O-methyltransferase (TylF)